MTQPRPIIIDCDPGQDDAIALLLALAAPDMLELRGITTVAGNVSLAMTQRNARLICDMVGKTDVPIYAGCPRPLVQPLVTAEEYHGENGLNGLELYEPDLPLQNTHAVNFLMDELARADDNSITLVAIGPLTNIACVLIQAPQLAAKIREIVIMGGSVREAGNVTAAAEFNIYVDPHAAEVVLNCRRPIALFGLDATHQARVPTHWRSRMDSLPKTPAAHILKVSVDYFAKAYKDIYDQDSAPVHDVLCVAYLLAPELFGGIYRHVAVETTSALT
ncbi:MAG: nucleoside hydrolase, partial [Deinococcota bacterium]